jgi:hypothetical protein
VVSDLDSPFSKLSDTRGKAGTTSSAHVRKVVVLEDGVGACADFTRNRFWCRCLYAIETEFSPWGTAEKHKARALENMLGSYGIPKLSSKYAHRFSNKVMIHHMVSAN